MKIILKFIILVFIATLLFVFKDDLIKVLKPSIINLYNNISVLLNKEIKNSIPVVDNNIIINNVKDIIEISNKLETPGALKVLNENYISNISNPKLSSKKIIEITNKYRKENSNLTPLTENQKLNFSAQKKLEDMFTKQYFEHISPDNIGVSDLATQVAYEYLTVGENLALGNFNNDDALVLAWMKSPGHRENILNNHYVEIGVAVGEGFYEGKKVWIAVQHFGLPKSICPEVDQLLRGIINIEEEQVQTMENDLAIRRKMIDDRVVYDDLTINQQIDKYNKMITVYNQLIFNLKEKIDIYNKQINDFNSCLIENTAFIE